MAAYAYGLVCLQCLTIVSEERRVDATWSDEFARGPVLDLERSCAHRISRSDHSGSFFSSTCAWVPFGNFFVKIIGTEVTWNIRVAGYLRQILPVSWE